MTDEGARHPDPSGTIRTTESVPSMHQQRVVAARYVLTAELGRGGMGVVWRAEDRMIGRQVAIKELRLPDSSTDAEVFQERVLREVRSGGRINDPAVVTVYDVVTEGDATFIVMELVEAPTLSDVVRQQGPLPPQQVAGIGVQVLSALQAAHEAGIVHRDVKPGNIMVGANGRVKLTDFGIAQAVDDPRLTTSGNLVGSPAFMSPERVAGQEAMPASDLWSLGATLFFAVEGIVAFERTSTAATLHAIMNEVPYLTHAQGPLASAIMGLLISSPDARLSAPQAAGLLSMASAQSGQSTPPAGQTALYPGQSPTMIGGQTRLGYPQQQAAGGQSKFKRNALLTGGGVVAVALLVGGVFLGKAIFSPAGDERMLPTLSYGQGGDITALNFKGGSYSCLNTQIAPARPIAESNWVDCEKQHFAEFYAGVQVLGGSTDSDAIPAAYPGSEQLAAAGQRRCALEFDSNSIPERDKSGLRYRALVPTQAAWEQASADSSNDDETRLVYCVLSAADGTPLSGQLDTPLR